MPKPDPAPRIKPVQPDEFTDETRDFFARWTGGFFKGADTNPVLRTFAHHPKLAELFSKLNVHLLTTNTVPVKLRQIAIMRTAWLCDAVYMWSSHLNTSMLCGLGTDLFGPIQRGPSDPYFTDFERSVMHATDELVQTHEVSDPTWQALSAEWNHQQMLDFLFTVGTYVLIAGVMRSTGVQRGEDLRELAEKYGAPGHKKEGLLF
jgi:4-carboxymuconolactone decarboxylase